MTGKPVLWKRLIHSLRTIMGRRNAKFDEAITRAKEGGFREYWVQQYVKENYRKLGFSALQGPFDAGCDFTGVYNGKRVNVEVERQVINFVQHSHDPKMVDILIALSDNYLGTGKVRGMEPTEWRKLLPEEVIVVDIKDFLEATHEMRKAYAIMKQEEEPAKREEMRRKMEEVSSLPYRAKFAFSTLYDLCSGETEGQEADRLYGPDAPEAFEAALVSTVNMYLDCFSPEEREGLSKHGKVMGLEYLSRKASRRLDELTEEDVGHIDEWLGVLRAEYGNRI